ncbi:MAG: peptidylprolyl isomerase [Nocardioidaceae bacterium]
MSTHPRARRLARSLAPLPLVAALALGAASCSGEDDTTASDVPSGPTVTCDYPADGDAAKDVAKPPAEASSAGTVAATIATSAGDIGVQLDAGATPCTVNSFLSLADQGYFDDTRCHRLTTQGIFVLQCGDPTGTGAGGPGYSFKDELSGKETYGAGTLAMANAGPDTNGSQFFIVYDDSQLPPAYTVFGRIDDQGLEVVRGVASAGTDNGSGDGAPATPVTIESVTTG